MKKVVAIMALVACSTVARAGGLGIYGANWSPNDADAGYGAGAKLQFGDTVAIELRGSYFQDLSDDVDSVGLDVDLEVIPLEVGLVIKIPTGGAITPYIGGGGGYYKMEVEAENILGQKQTIDIDDEIGWYAVGGLEIAISDGVALFGEAQYRQVEATAQGDDVDEIEEDVDIDLTGIGFNAGLLFAW